MELRKGKKVEFCSSEEGYGGAWFEGVIIAGSSGHGPCKIQYEKFVADDGKPLVEKVWARDMRPIPPRRRLPLRFSVRDPVEAYDTDCWWHGIIVKVELDLCVVYFPDTGTIMAYGRSLLRPAQKWFKGNWRLVPQARDRRVEQAIRAVFHSRETSSADDFFRANPVSVSCSELRGRQLKRVREEWQGNREGSSADDFFIANPVSRHCSETTGRQLKRVCEEWHSNECDEANVPKQEVSEETEEDQIGKSSESAHKTQLIAYRSLLQAFHVDRRRLSEKRLNLLDAVRIELHISERAHNLAMEEIASLLRIWGSPPPFWL